MATLRGDLRQRHLDEFEKRFNEWDIEHSKGASHTAGLIVKAASEAGWFTDLEADAIGDLATKQVRQLSIDVTELYASLVELDPN